MTELLKQLEKDFEQMKKELKLKSSFKELERIFFIQDFILKEGHISPRLSRQIAKRIVDAYVSWIQYLHGLIVPNPSSLINMEESQFFDDEERSQINKLIDRMMAFASRNSLLVIETSNEKERQFIDDSVALWNVLVPSLKLYMEKVGKGWNERAESKPRKKEKSVNPLSG